MFVPRGDSSPNDLLWKMERKTFLSIQFCFFFLSLIQKSSKFPFSLLFLPHPTHLYFFLRGGNPKNVTWCVEDRKRMKNARTRKSRTATLYIWLRYYRKYFRVCTYYIMMCVCVCMVFFFSCSVVPSGKEGRKGGNEKRKKKRKTKKKMASPELTIGRRTWNSQGIIKSACKRSGNGRPIRASRLPTLLVVRCSPLRVYK